MTQIPLPPITPQELARRPGSRQQHDRPVLVTGDNGHDPSGTISALGALLVYYHHYLQELFGLHREALIERDAGLARALAGLHRRMLVCHIDAEDALLLPLLVEISGSVRWPPEVYSLEHRKIMRLSDRLSERLCAAGEAVLTRGEVLRLLDQQRALMHLLEHHEQREEEFLVGEVGRNVPEFRLDNIVRSLAVRWQELEWQQRDMVAMYRSRLPPEILGL